MIDLGAEFANTNSIGINEIINVYHRREKYPCEKEFTADSFIMKKAKYLGDNYVMVPYEGEVKDTYSFKKYRN